MHPLVLLERRLPLEHLLAEAALELGLLVLPQVLAQVGRVGATLLAVAALVLLREGGRRGLTHSVSRLVDGIDLKKNFEQAGKFSTFLKSFSIVGFGTVPGTKI